MPNSHQQHWIQLDEDMDGGGTSKSLMISILAQGRGVLGSKSSSC